MSESFLSLVDPIVSIIGVGGLFFGVYSYRKGQVAKRVEVLFPLIEEFDKPNFEHAKHLLDSRPIIIKEEGTSESSTWTINELELILRDHRNQEEGVIKFAEAEIRKSFDSLLNFFSKLDYLLKMEQITKEETFIFQYYIDLAKAQEAVRTYIRIYKFPLHGHLDTCLITEEGLQVNERPNKFIYFLKNIEKKMQ